MKVIVDAYNVLHTMVKTDRINEQERKHFINLLSAYAKRKKHKVVVVFDAGPFLFPATEEKKGIVVKYSGPNDTADEIIMRYIKDHQGQSMVLVSSDRELCSAAAHYDVESIKAQDFYALLTERTPKKEASKYEHIVKTSEGQDLMVDLLMQQTKVPLKIDDMEGPVEDRQSASNKESKKERKRLQKIKKL